MRACSVPPRRLVAFHEARARAKLFGVAGDEMESQCRQALESHVVQCCEVYDTGECEGLKLVRRSDATCVARTAFFNSLVPVSRCKDHDTV